MVAFPFLPGRQLFISSHKGVCQPFPPILCPWMPCMLKKCQKHRWPLTAEAIGHKWTTDIKASKHTIGALWLIPQSTAFDITNMTTPSRYPTIRLSPQPVTLLTSALAGERQVGTFFYKKNSARRGHDWLKQQWKIWYRCHSLHGQTFRVYAGSNETSTKRVEFESSSPVFEYNGMWR